MDPAALIQKIEDRSFVVGVVGLGYVGMPLVMEFYRQGFRCIGFDVDAEKVARLEAGESYIQHIPDESVQALMAEGRFEPTADFARAGEADALLLCVPTPLGKHREPDLSYVVQTGESIQPHLRDGHLVVLESTTYPGTTDEVLREALEAGGMKAGRDFLLAYSPEREDPGNPEFSTGKIPKVVGGFDDASLRVAKAMYETIVVDTIVVSDTRTAEAVKLLENIFRSVNIALVNELKVVYERMGIDIWEVIEAAKTKPFGFMPFYPGPGLGGHCIPIDPFYLSWKAREYGISTRFIELAGEVNTSMPGYVVDRIFSELNKRGRALKDAKILVLGVAYKKDVGDVRESPGVTLIDLLERQGAKVDYNDPYVPTLPPMRKHDMDKESVPLDAEVIAAYDLVLITTAHSDYDFIEIVRHAKLVVDTRNATGAVAEGRDKIVKA